MFYNYYILATTTIIGGILQITFRRYEKSHPDVPNQVKKSKKRAVSKFIAKNGLVTGIGLGVTTIFFKEGFILLSGRLSSSNSKVIVTSKPKSIGQLATSKTAIGSFISGAVVSSIWIFRS